MEPVTLLLVLVLAFLLLGKAGGPPSAGSGTGPGNVGPLTGPEMSSNQSIPDGTACPPGTMWNGRGFTEPSFQTTHQKAQPVGAVAIDPVTAGTPLPTVASGSPEPVGVGRPEPGPS